MSILFVVQSQKYVAAIQVIEPYHITKSYPNMIIITPLVRWARILFFLWKECSRKIFWRKGGNNDII